MAQIMTLRKPGGLDNLQLGERATRAPGQGEVRVRIHASSLNFHDWAVVRGMPYTADGIVPMSDGAGVVLEVGEGVKDFAVGDAVLSLFFPQWVAGGPSPQAAKVMPGDTIDGFAAEEVTLPASAFTRAPKGWSHAEAATLTCAGLTAWRALMGDGPLLPGQSVLVQGTGGVSVFALQFAKMAGATVIATSSSDDKLERMKALGADHLINYKTTPDWGAAVRKLSGGGVDHVVEIGGAGTLPQSITACAMGGHIALIGVLAGVAGDVPTARLMASQIRLQGLMVGSRAQQLDMVRAVEASGMRPVIDSTFPLAQLADAFRHQLSGRHFGKICVSI